MSNAIQSPRLIRKIALRARYWLSLLRYGYNTSNPLIFDWLHDAEFSDIYTRALVAAALPPLGDMLHRQRAYVLWGLLKLLDPPSATVAECGVAEGVSSFVLCSVLARSESSGPTRYRAFDSFQGLSMIQEEDRTNRFHPELSLDRDAIGRTGLISVPLERVRRTLREFPFVSYHPGWIPSSFEGVDDRFSFVHIDLDLYQPIRDAARFFYPRMNDGGIMVFDDYGFLDWPGAKLAVEEFARESGAVPLRLPTGQAVVFVRR